ncbi:hypothetical protein P7C70_g9207, partial [Phenoliferia sp. Uapishka_3]
MRAPVYGQPRFPNLKLSLFEGSNISRFLKRYEMEFRSRGHCEETMAEYLPMYCKQEWFTMISDMSGCETRDWNELKRSMKDAFLDEEKHKYSLTSLRQFVGDLKQRGKPDKLSKISRVYFKFTAISTYLKKHSVIGVQEESRYFLSILPDEIVDMIHSRRDTRRLIKLGGDTNEDDEGCALPELQEIIKEVRSIYADFARRGKLSKIRSRREPDSDSDTMSDTSNGSFDSETSDDDDVFVTPKKSRSRSTRSGSKRAKSSKASDSDRGREKTKTPLKRKEEPKPKEDSMKDLLLKFSELQVTVAQLATQAQNNVIGGNSGPPFVRRNSFGNGMRPPGNPQGQQNPNPNANRWNAPRRDAPPHESNAAEYESTYYSNYVGTGSNATPLNTSTNNQWGNRPQASTSGTQNPTNGNFAPTPGPSGSVNGPFTPNGGSFAPRPPLCLWCAGEDGDPHWLNACADLTKATNDGIVRRDYEGKIRYGSRFIPARGHPRGMRAWVREQEELARTEIREANERSKERVRFGKEVHVSSIEYNPPEIDEHTEYESGNIQVDEYEVNQTKRPRSGASTDIPPPKIRTPRAPRPQDSLFEDLGIPRTPKPAEKDTEMKDLPKKRPTTVPKPKLESAVESKSDPRAFLEKILEQPITLPMSIMLANSPELAKLMVAECRRKRTPLIDHDVNHLQWDERESEIPQANSQAYEGKKKSYYAGVLAYANITIED